MTTRSTLLLVATLGCGTGTTSTPPATVGGGDSASGVDSAPPADSADPTTQPPSGRLIITELMADNRAAMRLSDDASPDWVELFNPGPDPVDLTGWTLTDDLDDPDPAPLFTADAPTLPGGGFVVALATGEVGTRDGYPTLPFKLDADGEALVLREPGGQVADTVAWETQYSDVSWGRPQTVTEQALIGDGAPARLAPGDPDGWSDPATDDSSWAAVTLPVGMDSSAGDVEDLALFAPAAQSSDWSSGYPAGNAVDGDPATFTHTATADSTPWWTVNLGDTATVTSITLGNRLGCCPERLYNIVVTVEDASGAAIFTSPVLNPVAAGDAPADPGSSLTVALDEPARGQVVRVAKQAVGGTYDSEWLSLGAVEVWGQWAPPYADWIATDITEELLAGGGAVSLRIQAPPTATRPTALWLDLAVDDTVAVAWDGEPVAAGSLPPGHHADLEGPTRTALDPDLAASGGLLAAHLTDTGGDDALLALRLIAATIDTDLDASVYFDVPTHGAPNGAGFPGFVSAPIADPPRGWLDGPTTVTLSTPSDGATLIYTLDGTPPSTDHGTEVDADTTTLDLDGTTVLRAIAVRDGWRDSSVLSATYLSMDDVLGQPEAPAGLPETWDGLAQAPVSADYAMDPEVVDDPAYRADLEAGLRAIPALSLVLPPDDLWGADDGIYVHSTQRGAAWERATSMELLEPDGGGTQADCGLRIHGYGWRPHSNTKKHSFRLEFRRDYGESKLTYPLFDDAPVDRFDSIVLRSQGSRGWQDFRDPEQSQYIRDAFARDTARDMGKADGRAAYVHLFLNGLYWGLYMAVERPDADFGAERFGGDADEYDAINRRTSTNEAIDGDLEAYLRLVEFADADLSVDANYQAVSELIDLDDLIDYMLIHQYTANRDGPEQFQHNNMRGVRRRLDGERFRFFVWDMEYSLWNADDHINIEVDVPGSVSHVYARLRDNADFRARYAARAALHLTGSGALTPEAARERYDDRAEQIFDAVVAESARWGDAKRATPYTRDEEWATEYQRLTDLFFPQRTDVLIEQLRDAGLY